LKKTKLFQFHKNQSQIGHYAGFEMPFCYKSSIIEHKSVRNNVGIFDISHMGRLLIKGHQAQGFLNKLLTYNISRLEVMNAQLTFFCNKSGGIIDDVIVLRLDDNEFLIIVNAINKKKDILWMQKNISNFDVTLKDLTEKVPMIALQGPNRQKLSKKSSVLKLTKSSAYGVLGIIWMKRSC